MLSNIPSLTLKFRCASSSLTRRGGCGTPARTTTKSGTFTSTIFRMGFRIPCDRKVHKEAGLAKGGYAAPLREPRLVVGNPRGDTCWGPALLRPSATAVGYSYAHSLLFTEPLHPGQQRNAFPRERNGRLGADRSSSNRGRENRDRRALRHLASKPWRFRLRLSGIPLWW